MIDAAYTQNELYPGNPFIEALPPVLFEQELVDKLSYYPAYNLDDRFLPANIRLQKLNEIFQVYQPLPMTIKLYHQVYNCLLTSFSQKDLFLKKRACGKGLSIIGISGIGKTTAIDKILRLFPQVIRHTHYGEQPFFCHQINFIQVECPHDSSVKGLCFAILSEFDRLLDTNYFDRATKNRMSVDAMVVQLTTLSQWVGLLVVDECQNIVGPKTGILNFLTQLMNNGVSIVMLATPQFLPVLKQQFRLIRRANIITAGKLEDDEFELLLQSLWQYQYTQKEVSLSAELVYFLKEKSYCIPDVVAKIYHYTQMEAILNGKEKVDVKLMQSAMQKYMGVIEDFISQINAFGERGMLQYEDVLLPKDKGREAKGGKPRKQMESSDLRKIAKQVKRENRNLFQKLTELGYIKGVV